ncbi:MAG: hypothetical protein M1827_003036 [Pycnora praestabilis]|nr:MAG: hypothetical protein M1827_003036 [Pycnora praestabilis]
MRFRLVHLLGLGAALLSGTHAQISCIIENGTEAKQPTFISVISYTTELQSCLDNYRWNNFNGDYCNTSIGVDIGMYKGANNDYSGNALNCYDDCSPCLSNATLYGATTVQCLSYTTDLNGDSGHCWMGFELVHIDPEKTFIIPVNNSQIDSESEQDLADDEPVEVIPVQPADPMFPTHSSVVLEVLPISTMSSSTLGMANVEALIITTNSIPLTSPQAIANLAPRSAEPVPSLPVTLQAKLGPANPSPVATPRQRRTL